MSAEAESKKGKRLIWTEGAAQKLEGDWKEVEKKKELVNTECREFKRRARRMLRR